MLSIWPFNKLKKLQEENKRLQGVITKQLTGDITLDDIRVKGSTFCVSLSGSPMHIFTEAFVEQFNKSNAINFITADFGDRKTGDKYNITLQKVIGESVADQLGRLKGELDFINKAGGHNVDPFMLAEIIRQAYTIGQIDAERGELKNANYRVRKILNEILHQISVGNIKPLYMCDAKTKLAAMGPDATGPTDYDGAGRRKLPGCDHEWDYGVGEGDTCIKCGDKDWM